MRPYSPGGMLIALATAQPDWVPVTPSIHRLGLGLPGYLILFAPLAFAPQRQKWSSAPLSPQVFLPISTHFTATPGIPRTSPSLQHTVSPAGSRLSREISQVTCGTAYAPFTPNNSEQRSHLCITAAAGTKLAGASSTSTVIIVLVERSLRPKGLHPPRGVAASGFPPLRKIPHCCLP